MAASMSNLTIKKSLLTFRFNTVCSRLTSTVSREQDSSDGGKEKFRKLKIEGVHHIKDFKFKRRSYIRPERTPRYKLMKVDQDWTNVWPTAASFKWSVAPFPVRQGAVFNAHQNQGIIPDKYANAELMKIPNFLHLTPSHIKKHCTALKDLCTEWPKGLTDENCEQHFPIESITRDYCFTSNSIRDPRSRVVTSKFKLSNLKMDAHGKEKFIRLVGDRYNKETDEVTLTSDRCPLKTQNFDYIMYLITVLYHESMTVEPWESEMTVEDMKEVVWEFSSSRKNVLALLDKIYDTETEDARDADQKKLSYLTQRPKENTETEISEIQHYKNNMLHVVNCGETESSLENYKQSVLELLDIPKLEME